MFVTLNHSQLTNRPQKTKKSRTRYRFYLDPINAFKTPKTSNYMLKKSNWTALLKEFISRKKITKPIQRNLGLRLTIEEFLKIFIAHISFQTNNWRVSTLTRGRVLLIFCTSLSTLSQFLEWPRSVID